MTKVREYTSRHAKVRVVSLYTTHNERQKSTVSILSYFNLQSILKFEQVTCQKSVVFNYEKKITLIYTNLFCDFFRGC